MRKLLIQEEFIRRGITIHADFYDYSKVKYINYNTKVIIICKEHDEFLQRPSCHLVGQGCPKCGYKKMHKNRNYPCKYNTTTFIEAAKIKHGDVYSYDKVSYQTYESPVLIFCNKYNHEFWQKPTCHLQGYGCKQCANIKVGNYFKLNQKEFIIRAKQIHNNKYCYDLVNYIDGRQKVIIICNVHGPFSQTPSSHLQNHGCVQCKQSKGEKKIQKYLDQNNIKAISEYCIPNTKKRFDFFIPFFSCIVEFNGLQHYIPSSFSTNQDMDYKLSNLKKTYKSDIYKDNWCKNNKITLLRIHYWEYNQINKILDWFFKEYLSNERN